MNFHIAQQRSDEDIARTGHGSIQYKVKGFWSASTISIYVDRTWNGGGDIGWTVSISRSSGGRDTDEVADDIEANQYYAEALLDATRVAKEYVARFDQLEAEYQRQAEIQRAERKQREIEKQKIIDADIEVGIEQATQIIEQTIVDVKRNGRCKNFVIGHRGNHNITDRLQVALTFNDKAYCKFNGGRISKAHAIAELAGSSKMFFEDKNDENK